jgi:hypothetical protein
MLIACLLTLPGRAPVNFLYVRFALGSPFLQANHPKYQRNIEGFTILHPFSTDENCNLVPAMKTVLKACLTTRRSSHSAPETYHWKHGARIGWLPQCVK